MITVIDYQMGNLRSVEKAFLRLNQKVQLTSSKEVIRDANRLILPGVGNFKAGMQHLKELDLIDTIKAKALEDKVPILGICLGMQLLTNHSEEGHCEGLGLIEGETKKFDFRQDRLLKVPHIGWNNLEINNSTPLLEGITAADKFYFVHSYFVNAAKPENSIASTTYGNKFDSIIALENIIGVQFHPEKSHDTGLLLLKNFMNNY